MSEYRSTLDLVSNEEQKINDCWKKRVIHPDQESHHHFEKLQEEYWKERRKLPSLVEGDFSPLGITSLKQSFFSKIRDARIKASDEWTFLLSLLTITSGPFLWIICLFVSIVIPLMMLIIGSFWINDCSSYPVIPILFILFGLLTCLGNTINIVDSTFRWKSIFGWNRSNDRWTRFVSVTNVTINACDIIIMIVLSLIILLTSTPSYSASDSDYKNYCNPIVYRTAYWIVYFTIFYLITIISLIIISMGISFVKTIFYLNKKP